MDKPQFQHPQPQSEQPAYGQVYSNALSNDDLQKQVQQLSSRLDLFINKRINWNTDIIGLFETVSAVPTLTPTKPYDQIKFYSNATTYRLYVYDQTNQVWRYATLT